MKMSNAEKELHLETLSDLQAEIANCTGAMPIHKVKEIVTTAFEPFTGIRLHFDLDLEVVQAPADLLTSPQQMEALYRDLSEPAKYLKVSSVAATSAFAIGRYLSNNGPSDIAVRNNLLAMLASLQIALDLVKP